MAEDSLFPILNRNAPLLERLRNGQGDAGDILSDAVLEILNEDDEDRIEEIAADAIDEIRADISEASDIPQDSLNGEFFDQLRGALIQLSPDNILDRAREADVEDANDDSQADLTRF